MILRNKLILSCAALAAVATTAVSTTFAWYTSNDTVKANGINGTTADTGSDLLLIADGLDSSGSAVNTTNLKWSTAISNVNEVQPTPTDGDGMMPLAVNSQGGLLELDPATGKTATGTDISDDCLKFVLYVKNAGATDKYVNLSLTKLDNTTGVTTTQTTPVLPTKSVVKSATGDPYSSLNLTDSTYSANVLRVLAVNFTATPTTAGTAGDAVTKNYTLTPSESSMGDTLPTGFDAHDYYNKVMNTEAEGSTNASLVATNETTKNTTAFDGALDEAGANTYRFKLTKGKDGKTWIKFEFRVYIDGWNKACFDACQGQTFEMGWKFSIDSNQAD